MKAQVVFRYLVFFTVLILFRTGYGQRASARNNDIAGDIVGYLMPNNIISLQYEWKGNSFQSWVVRGEYVLPGGAIKAIGFGAAMRFYILDSRALADWSVGPAADVFFFKNNDLDRSKTVFAIGGDFAHKWFFDQFTVEPSVGARWGITGNDFTGISRFSGTYLIANIFFGWAW